MSEGGKKREKVEERKKVHKMKGMGNSAENRRKEEKRMNIRYCGKRRERRCEVEMV